MPNIDTFAFMFVLAIIFTASLVVAFKVFERLGIVVFHAIVINYGVAVTCGLLLNNKVIFQLQEASLNLWLLAAIIGSLFISVFSLMGKSAIVAGISATSLANKMSLVFPIVLGALFWGDKLKTGAWIGIVFSMIALYLITKKPNAALQTTRGTYKLLLPLLVFIGSGAIDGLMAYATKFAVSSDMGSAFLLVLFAVAFFIGCISMAQQYQKLKQPLQINAAFGGLILGVVNYFSVYCFLAALANSHFSTGVFYGLFNVSVVLVSIFISVLFFKEKLSILNWLGVSLAVLAIILLQ